MFVWVLQQISYALQQCTIFENPLRFEKVTESVQVGTFFETQCIYAMAGANNFKFGMKLGFAKAHHKKHTQMKKWAWSWAREAQKYLSFPFNISATAAQSSQRQRSFLSVTLKVKVKQSTYIAPCVVNHLKALRHGSHSFLPAKNTMPAFTS